LVGFLQTWISRRLKYTPRLSLLLRCWLLGFGGAGVFGHGWRHQ
jgi:hypothetical protein